MSITMREQQMSLPIRQQQKALVEAIRQNETVIVIGETGSGKTTQLAQMLLEEGMASGDGPESKRPSQIAVTQPRRVGAVTVAKRVAEERGSELGKEVGYAVRFEDCSGPETRIKFLTDGTLLREVMEDPLLSRYSVVILDEAHERSLNTDVLFGVLKRMLVRRRAAKVPPLRLVVTSATLDGEKFSAYFNEAPVFNVPGRCFPVDIVYAKEDHFKDYASAAIDTVLQIHTSQPPGDILVFLTGQAEIEKTVTKINAEVSALPGGSCGPLLVLPLHASLPPEMQVRVFRPAPEGVRRCIVATNVAETSVTVDGVVYVVDSGVVKQKHYQPSTGMDSLDVVPISRVGATQRAGRAGRTRPGMCFRLYSKMFFDGQMPNVTLPEIQRSSLTSATLYLKSLEIDDLDILSFEFLDSPGREALEDSLKQLYCLDAIDSDGAITLLGRRMSALPLDPSLARALIEAEQLGCAREVMVISAMLSTEHVFHAGQGPSDHPRPPPPSDGGFSSRGGHNHKGGGAKGPTEALKELIQLGEGDHFLLLRLWTLWEKGGCSKNVAYDLGLDLRGMNFARDVLRQLEGIVRDLGSKSDANGSRKRGREAEEVEIENERGRDSKEVQNRRGADDRWDAQKTNEQAARKELRIEETRRALTKGFANKLARRLPHHNGYRTVGSGKGQLAQLHPGCSSVREDEDGLLPEWVIYHELVSTSKPFLRNVCPTRGSYVEPLLKKMLDVDVRRLSKGRALIQPEGAIAGLSGAGEGGGDEAKVEHQAQKRNDDKSVSAAKERYLARKSAAPAAVKKR